MYVMKRVDSKCFDPHLTGGQYPAISIERALDTNDSLVLRFSSKVLEKCSEVQSLSVNYFKRRAVISEDTDYILGSFRSHVLANLKELTVGDYEYLSPEVDTDAFKVSINNSDYKVALKCLDTILNKYNMRRREPWVYLKSSLLKENQYDISRIVPEQVKELSLQGNRRGRCVLIAAEDFPPRPTLTCMTLGHFQIDTSASLALRKAVADGKLPELRRIHLTHCTMNDSDWPEVQEFCFQADDIPRKSRVQQPLGFSLGALRSTSSDLGETDYQLRKLFRLFSIVNLFRMAPVHVSNLVNVLRQGQMPNLSELCITFAGRENKSLLSRFANFQQNVGKKDYISDSFVPDLDPTKTPLLKKLTLKQVISSANQLATLSDKLTRLNLHYLDLTESVGVTGSLSLLFGHRFPTLDTLILRKCALNSEDLKSLGQGNVQGKFLN